MINDVLLNKLSADGKFGDAIDYLLAILNKNKFDDFLNYQIELAYFYELSGKNIEALKVYELIYEKYLNNSIESNLTTGDMVRVTHRLFLCYTKIQPENAINFFNKSIKLKLFNSWIIADYFKFCFMSSLPLTIEEIKKLWDLIEDESGLEQVIENIYMILYDEARQLKKGVNLHIYV